MPDCDVLVIGAGILGTATARRLARSDRGLSVVVVDKEDRVATHQSGRNSGVIHSGIYYAPGSDKATMVARGRDRLVGFARHHGIPHEICGKVIVATAPGQVAALDALRRRADDLGIGCRLLSQAELRHVEPHASGVAALHVPSTGVIDFAAVARALAAELLDAGGTLLLGTEVAGLAEDRDTVRVRAGTTVISARVVVNCGGLQADLVAGLTAGAPPDLLIVPFRGEYHELVPERRGLVNGLIYPVPDPRFPFLGVHLSRGVDGRVHVGPNAVMALAREGYSWTAVDPGHVAALSGGPQLRWLARRYWRTGLAEVSRSVSRRALARSVQRLVPEVTAADLVPARSGVRAQAVRADGTLVDDFAFHETTRTVHVLNAPSPGATASLEIGRAIAARALHMLADPGAGR